MSVVNGGDSNIDGDDYVRPRSFGIIAYIECTLHYKFNNDVI